MKKVLSLGVVFAMILALAVLAITAPQKTNGYVEADETYGAVASAKVDKLNGNQNGLTITVKVDNEIVAEAYYLIKNNSAGEFAVGDYKVYVSTYGNDKIDFCFITYAPPPAEESIEPITVTPDATVGGDELVITVTGLIDGWSQFDIGLIFGQPGGPYSYALWFEDGGTASFSKNVTLSYQGATTRDVAAGETIVIDASWSEYALFLDDGNTIIFIASSSPGNYAGLPPAMSLDDFPGKISNRTTTVTPDATVGGDKLVITVTGLIDGWSQFDAGLMFGTPGAGPYSYALWFEDGGTASFSKDVTLSYQGATTRNVAAGETIVIDASLSEYALFLDDGNIITFIASSSPGNYAGLPPTLPLSGFPGVITGKTGGGSGSTTPKLQKLTYDFWNPFTEEYETLPYYLFVSSKVTPGKPAPLIVALHGMGADASYLMNGRFLQLAEEGGYIAVGPLGYDGDGYSGWYGSPWMGQSAEMPVLSEKDVMDVLQMIRGEFSIDPKRTYMMGHSMGGAGTLFLGQKHSSEWAALAPIAPAAFMMQTNRAAYLEPIRDANIPVIVIQGDSDDLVPASNTRQWIATMEQMEIRHEYIEIAGLDHGTIIPAAMDDIFRFFAENVKAPEPGEITREYANIRYASETTNNDRVLDLTLPATGEGPFPLLIFIHGGGFVAGSKADVNGTAFAQAPARGYALASLNYRLAPFVGTSGRFPDGIQDCLAAIRFLRANADTYHLDPTRFALAGFSAGAYHTAFIAAFTGSENIGGITEDLSLGNAEYSSAIQAAVTWSALTDFLMLDVWQDMNTDVNYLFRHDDDGPFSPETTYFGSQISLPENADALAKSNPFNYVSANMPPILMQHATNDNLVPWQSSQTLVDRINDICGDGRAEFDFIPNGGHGGAPFSSQANTDRIFQYLDEKLDIER